MTNQTDEPEVEFIDLDAVEQVVETVLYPDDCDELDTFTLTAGTDPFILLQMSQVPGENTLAYQIYGSVINAEADLLQTLEVFTEALRQKVENDAASAAAVEGEVVDHG